MDIPMFDPLAAVNHIIVIAVLIVVIFFLWTYRKNVMLALTGDSKIHLDFLDCLWYTARCGGFCNGEWTRCISSLCCCKSVRGQNLVQAFGRLLGLHSRQIELKQLTVGDLPFSGRGDFFLSITSGTNPAQVTSLAEDKDPKVVSFPEILTLRIRESMLEERVKFEVKELNVLGFQTLCVVHVNALTLLSWLDSPNPADRTKRVEMKPQNTEFELESQPWILISLEEPLEPRELGTMGTNPSSVRTRTGEAGHWQDRSFKEFKEDYRLLNPTGDSVAEPDEDDLGTLRHYRRCLKFFLWIFNSLATLVILVYCFFRFYLYSCYMQFRMITIAKLHNTSFPISTNDLDKLEDECHEDVRGTGVAFGPCRPTDAQIEITCEHLPPGQPEPGAGKVLARRTLELDIDGFQCYRGSAIHGETSIAHLFDEYAYGDRNVCQVRNEVVPYDLAIFASLIGLMLMTCCCRFGVNEFIRWRKRDMQSHRAGELRDALDEMKRRKEGGVTSATSATRTPAAAKRS